MTRKQLVTRTEIAKMVGQDKRYFLNRDARRLQKPPDDIAGLSKLGFHLIEVPIGSASCAFHRHICEEECIYILEGSGTARIGDTVLQVEAGDLIAYLAGGEAHDLHNTGSSLLKCIIVGQRLDFDIVDYPEQARRPHRAKGEKGDLVDMAVIVPRHEQAIKYELEISGKKSRRASDRESADQAVEFAPQADPAFHPM